MKLKDEIKKEPVQTENTEVKEPKKAPKEKAPETRKVVGCTTLNCRQRPSLKADVLQLIKVGSIVTVIKDENGWTQYTYDGITGWSMSEYLSSVQEG